MTHRANHYSTTVLHIFAETASAIRSLVETRMEPYQTSYCILTDVNLQLKRRRYTLPSLLNNIWLRLKFKYFNIVQITIHHSTLITYEWCTQYWFTSNVWQVENSDEERSLSMINSIIYTCSVFQFQGRKHLQDISDIIYGRNNDRRMSTKM